MTEEEFARRADANCAHVNEFAGRLGSPATVEETVTFLEKLIPEVWRSYGLQGTLVPPAEMEDVGMRWMNAMALMIRELEHMRDAAKRGDESALSKATARNEAFGREMSRLSAEMGMKTCAEG